MGDGGKNSELPDVSKESEEVSEARESIDKATLKPEEDKESKGNIKEAEAAEKELVAAVEEAPDPKPEDISLSVDNVKIDGVGDGMITVESAPEPLAIIDSNDREVIIDSNDREVIIDSNDRASTGPDLDGVAIIDSNDGTSRVGIIDSNDREVIIDSNDGTSSVGIIDSNDGTNRDGDSRESIGTWPTPETPADGIAVSMDPDPVDLDEKSTAEVPDGRDWIEEDADVQVPDGRDWIAEDTDVQVPDGRDWTGADGQVMQDEEGGLQAMGTDGLMMEDDEDVQARDADGLVMQEEEGGLQAWGADDPVMDEEGPVQARTAGLAEEEKEPIQELPVQELVSRISDQLPDGADKFTDQAAVGIVETVMAGETKDFLSPTRDAIQGQFRNISAEQSDALIAVSLNKAANSMENSGGELPDPSPGSDPGSGISPSHTGTDPTGSTDTSTDVIGTSGAVEDIRISIQEKIAELHQQLIDEYKSGGDSAKALHKMAIRLLKEVAERQQQNIDTMQNT